MSQTFACIIREEKFKALWKGHVSAQILSAIYGEYCFDMNFVLDRFLILFFLKGMVYFSSFELFTKGAFQWLINHDQYISREVVIHSAPVINFACGSLSGFVSTTLSHPFDVVRTRMVSQSEPKTYRNFRHAVTSLWEREALKGFYRGYLPTVTQIMPYSGAQLASYNFFKDMWLATFEVDHLSWPFGEEHELRLQSSLVCGAASGTFAKLATYPLDLIKKRLQIRGFEEARGTGFGKVPYYNGFIHCVVYTIQNESLAAFYKGLYPSLVKAMLTTALNFWLYESMMKTLETAIIED